MGTSINSKLVGQLLDCPIYLYILDSNASLPELSDKEAIALCDVALFIAKPDIPEIINRAKAYNNADIVMIFLINRNVPYQDKIYNVRLKYRTLGFSEFDNAQAIWTVTQIK